MLVPRLVVEEVLRLQRLLHLREPDRVSGARQAGRGLQPVERDPGVLNAARGHGAGALTSAEALAYVVLETSDEPLFVTNVDLTEARVGGLGTDVVRTFLEVLAENAGLVLHVRLLNGTDSGHVLDAIFKGLGAALAEACERLEARP